MTRSEIRTLVLNLADFGTSNYILDSQTTLLDELIDERFKLFSLLTRCLYDDKISFTLTIGTDQYTMDSTSVFTRAIFDVNRVMVNGSYILRASADQVSLIDSGYLTQGNDLPAIWWTHPQRLMLYPKPDQAYSESYVSAWFYHPAFSSDSTESDIPEEFQRSACRFTAEALAEVSVRKNPDLFPLYNDLRLQNARDIELIRNRMDKQYHGRPSQRARGKTVIRTLG